MISEPLRRVARPTTVIECVRLSTVIGGDLTFVTETFQHTGSFKFRAAYNLAQKVDSNKILTASSGNFGQALAYACRILSKDCIVVMPSSSAIVKIEAVKFWGGKVELVDVKMKSRAQRLQEVAADNPDALVASAYDDDLVIEGNASLGEEICLLGKPFDYIVVPVGGGGLSSGICQAVQRMKPSMKVVGAEPLLANDAARSLAKGELLANEQESQTLADGARVLSLGRRNWQILRTGLDSIIEVPEDQITEAMRLLFGLANLKVEPTGALSLAAILSQPGRFKNRSVCCVVSGGNVDPVTFAEIVCDSTNSSAQTLHQ